jgi:hypothetical protein
LRSYRTASHSIGTFQCRAQLFLILRAQNLPPLLFAIISSLCPPDAGLDDFLSSSPECGLRIKLRDNGALRLTLMETEVERDAESSRGL